MKTILVQRPGGPECLQVVEAEIPKIGPDDVLIKAQVFGVGRTDALIARGIYRWMPSLPANPGNDAAGFVSAVGENVRDIAVGQKALVSSRELPKRGGCYAEYIAVPADAVFPLRDDIDLHDAVSLSNYQIAWALLNKCGAPYPPRSILVVGAAGGVGSALVQLGKLAKLLVIGTVSTPEKASFAKANGADETILYRQEDVISRALELTSQHGISLIFDHVGGAQFPRYLHALSKWGTLVSYNAFADLPEGNVFEEMRKRSDLAVGVRCFSFHIYDDDRAGRREIMYRLIEALGRGEFKPPRSKSFSFSDVRSAHELLNSGNALGKITMVMD